MPRFASEYLWRGTQLSYNALDERRDNGVGVHAVVDLSGGPAEMIEQACRYTMDNMPLMMPGTVSVNSQLQATGTLITPQCVIVQLSYGRRPQDRTNWDPFANAEERWFGYERNREAFRLNLDTSVTTPVVISDGEVITASNNETFILSEGERSRLTQITVSDILDTYPGDAIAGLLNSINQDAVTINGRVRPAFTLSLEGVDWNPIYYGGGQAGGRIQYRIEERGTPRLNYRLGFQTVPQPPANGATLGDRISVSTLSATAANDIGAPQDWLEKFPVGTLAGLGPAT